LEFREREILAHVPSDSFSDSYFIDIPSMLMSSK